MLPRPAHHGSKAAEVFLSVAVGEPDRVAVAVRVGRGGGVAVRVSVG